MIDGQGSKLSLVRQCSLLDISRGSVYYRPTPAKAEDLDLMDRQYMKTPFYGSRRMRVWLSGQGHPVGRDKTKRLMRLADLEAVYRRPNTSRPTPEHKVYPYLLKGMKIDRVDQVWTADITYIPMARGFLYLVAIMDWYSRYVLAWRLSNTLEVGFCVDALEEALGKGKPEVFNTDQGSQFTSEGFTGLLKQRGIRISMDGNGRYKDNIFVERLWRTVKYEEVYLKAYTDGMQANIGLKSYFHFYNNQRPHQALGYRTPAEVIDGESPAPNDQSAERRWPSIKPAEHPGKPAGFSLNVPLNLSS
jgi:putative transposase